jgi:hypothetical protein
MCYVGEQVVNHARSLPSMNPAGLKHIPPHQPNYIDWTANLRSSVGYVVVVEGQVAKMSDFTPVKNGTQGATDGKAFAMQLVSKFPKGIVLIVVAGMHYASYVSAKGYDVIDSAELLAQQLVPEILKRLSSK